MEDRYLALRRILGEIGPCLVAFSGGVDSTFLLRVATDVLGVGAMAVTAVSPSLPAAEKEAAIALAKLIGAPHLLVETHELDDPAYAANDGRRCYHCKSELFASLLRLASERGSSALVYGAIPDDFAEERPGMQAAAEFSVRAPLIEAGLTKAMIRELSKRLGLPTWDKPAMACLASRIPRFTPVTADALRRVELAESAIRALGYRQVRVRHHGDEASIELDGEGLARSSPPESRQRLVDAVCGAGFRRASIDPRGYRPGGAVAFHSD